MSPADLADYADETQNNKTSTTTLPTQPVFLCELMQLAAFLCVLCVICERIFTQEYSIYLHKETPMSPADFADSRRQTTKPQNNINLTYLSFSAK
jgi:hypothetical protein